MLLINLTVIFFLRSDSMIHQYNLTQIEQFHYGLVMNAQNNEKSNNKAHVHKKKQNASQPDPCFHFQVEVSEHPLITLTTILPKT